MKKLLASIAAFAVILTTTPAFAPTVDAATIPKAPALFTTSLLSRIDSTATSMTLVSGLMKNGSAISGYTCFTIDEGSSNEEFACGIASSTSVTSMLRGIDPVDGDLEVSSLKKAHNRGASVKVTNYPITGVLARILNGDETVPNALRYDSSVTTSTLYSNAQNLASIAALNDVVAVGCGNASETGRGCSELATPGELASSTSAGGTGARLVAPGSAFSSTGGSSQVAVVTNASGTINSSFISTSTIASALTAASSTITAALNTFGDGSDGSLTIAGGSTTTLTRSMFYTNLTVNGTLVTNGYQVFVNGTINGTGTVMFPDPTATSTVTGIFSGTVGNVGGDRGSGTGNPGLAATSTTTYGCLGSDGRPGGAANNSTGSNSSSTCSLSRKFGILAADVLTGTTASSTAPITIRAQGAAGGGAGGGNASGNNGGGGGQGGVSGGIVWISANTWAGTFTIRAVGSNGTNGQAAVSNASGGGGGSGGNGGISIVVYGTKTWSGSYVLTAGSGGSGGTSPSGTPGTAGVAGVTGTSYEIAASSLNR